MDKNADSFFNAAMQLPQELAGALYCVPEAVAAAVTEIRLRSGRPVVLTTAGESLLVRKNGAIAATPTGELLCTSHALLGACFHAICAYSVHSFEHSIAQGFVPLAGGHRAGICGTAVMGENSVVTLKNITSINIRVARTALCTCDAQIAQLLTQETGGIILAGEPGSGKTTVLRAVMQSLSERGIRTAVIDERFELAPVEQAGFFTPPPLHCDVLSGYPKHIGMLQALRSMAPDVLLCDEIGTMDDVNAIERAANAGVRLFVTLHGDSTTALSRRPQMEALFSMGAFSWLVLLRGKQAPGEVREVIQLAHSM